MNAGKSTLLLQYRHNLMCRNIHFFCGSPINNLIRSRIGITCEAIHITTNLVSNYLHGYEACILIDEAQFLTRDQVLDLCTLSETVDIRTYGLRTDFLGNLFEGSAALLSLSDRLIEIETSCFCTRKATMTVRLNDANQPLSDGEQCQIEGKYISLCMKHYFECMKNKSIVLF